MWSNHKPKEVIINITMTTVALLLISATILLVDLLAQKSGEKKVIVGDNKIKIELAQTAEEQTLGLGQRASLDKDSGMVFVYKRDVVPSFWMKDMNFPLDIIWIKDDMVVGFEKNVPVPEPGVALPYYQPQTFINYVLEVNAGFVEERGLKIGDKVEFIL